MQAGGFLGDAMPTRKRPILACTAVAALFALALAAVFPSPFWPGLPALLHSIGLFALGTVVIANGVAVGATLPLLMEFAADLSAPAPPGLSACAVLGAMLLFSIAGFGVLPLLPPSLN